MNDYKRLAWTIIVFATLALPVAATEQSSNAPGQLDGWQNAKFGMTLEQIKASYLVAQVEAAPAQSCKSIAKALLRDRPPDSRDIAEESYRMLYEDKEFPLPPSWHYDCRSLAIQEWDLGRDRFAIEFSFSRTDQGLEEVKLKTRKADSQAYAYYKHILEGKYGQGRESNNRTDVQVHCDSIVSSLKRNVNMRGWMIGANQETVLNELVFPNGAVRLRQKSVAWCEGYRDFPWAQNMYENTRKQGITIEIEYKHNPTISPSESKNF